MSRRTARGVFVVGAGRLGRTLALAVQGPAFELHGTWNRTAREASRTRRLLGRGPCSGAALPARIRDAELILLCVGDDAVESVATSLVEGELVGPGQLVAHCAGALSLAPLRACAAAGVAVGSLHPLRAFVDPRRDLAHLPGTLAVIDAEGATARATLTDFATSLDLRPATLAAEASARARYHAAAVTVAGNLCALVDAALELADGAGLAPEQARDGLLELARGVLDAIEEKGGCAPALTGPVARGDEKVIEAHREAMGPLSPDLLAIYDLLIARSRRLKDSD